MEEVKALLKEQNALLEKQNIILDGYLDALLMAQITQVSPSSRETLFTALKRVRNEVDACKTSAE